MNYHYMDYMLKERRKLEMEEYRRIQLLAAAGYGKPTLVNRFISLAKKRVKEWSARLTGYLNHAYQHQAKLKGYWALQCKRRGANNF